MSNPYPDLPQKGQAVPGKGELDNPDSTEGTDPLEIADEQINLAEADDPQFDPMGEGPDD
jgi:hypothetical protein